jgi:DNA repair exonuclease SbcCD nuclease subunit
MKNVSAILTADWHLRADKPICRTDDFTEAMWVKIEFIFNLANKHNCPILIAGDLGHRSQWPNPLIEKFISSINNSKVKIIAIPGQHDLPNHSLKLYRKSAVGILSEDKTIKLIGVALSKDDSLFLQLPSFDVFPFPYGLPITLEKEYDYNDLGYKTIAMSHQMVIENKPLFPGQEDAPKGHQLLKKFPEYQLILTGDNHSPFTVSTKIPKHQGGILVNPGSMMRTTVDQIDHKPRVYLWSAETNEIEPVYLPIEQNVISHRHMSVVERNERTSAYVKRLKLGFKVGLDFKKNMEKHLKKTRTRRQVKERIWEAFEKGEQNVK